MNLRPIGIVVALLVSTLALAQRPTENRGKQLRVASSLDLAQKSAARQDEQSVGQTTLLERGRGGQKRYESVTIDTLAFFPQISSAYGQRIIRPDNHFRRPSSTSGLEPGGITSMTAMAGPSRNAFFPGLGMTSFYPADPDIAVGPGHIVQVVNTTIAFFTKAGAMGFSAPATTFFSGVAETTFLFDPKVFYDDIAARFVVVMLELSTGMPSVGNVLFAVSDNSDPNGTWHTYAFDIVQKVQGMDFYMDYPGFGFNKDGYVVCGDMFNGPGTFTIGVKFITIPKAPTLTGSAVTITPFPDNTFDVLSAQMAEMHDPANGFLFGAARFLTNQALTRFYAFTDIGDSGLVSLVRQDFSTANSPQPISDADSTGGKVLKTVDDRIMTIRYRNSRLYYSHNHGVSSTIVGTRWSEFDMGTWPTSGSITELQAGNYTSGTLNYFMPAVNVNKHGDVSILFTGSSTSVTSDIVVAGRISSDPLGTMSAPTVMASAAGSAYSLIPPRWGDYFDVEVDPVDGETFWGTAMVVRGDNWWATHILSWTVSQTSFNAPGSSLWSRGFVQSGNLASLASDDDDYQVTRAGLTLFLGESPAQLIIDVVGPTGTILDFELSVIAKVDTPGLTQTV
ncbi:MAG: hypothetical protein IIA44_08710, partial [Acidobacteria bacterium]|nr:hypothetical protein [Acidobacteriota bacterium]